jgi:FkbM family methyltransferase
MRPLSTATLTENINHLEAQLELLLAEGVSGAMQRERTEFDRLTGRCNQSLVLFGARKLGRKTLAGLRTAGIEPRAFSDNNAELWGTSIDGVPVLSPEDAARRFGADSAFVITIWGRGSLDQMAARKRRLAQLGCRTVVTFVPLFWKYAKIFLPHNALNLPHYVHESAADVIRCFHALSDEESRREFIGQLSWRIHGDFDALSDPTADEIYFPRRIAPEETEVFVDCGAYDGDTIVTFLSRRGGEFGKIFAFEPDPGNLAALQNTIASLPVGVRQRIQVMPYALGAQEAPVRFSATGTLGSAIGAGELEVPCVRLDTVLANERPTYIKMDIEAAEPDALRGAKEIIRKNRPVIAACSYHVQNHLWVIPLVMSELNPEYAILLRPHIQLVEDLVSYAVPRQRLVAARAATA